MPTAENSHGQGSQTALLRQLLTKDADFSVDPADTEGIYICDAVDLVATLPPTQKGLRYTFIVKTVSATTGLSISPNADDAIYGNGFTVAVDKDAINTAATDAVGDAITLVGDGADGWFIESIIGTWAREA